LLSYAGLNFIPASFRAYTLNVCTRLRRRIVRASVCSETVTLSFAQSKHTTCSLRGTQHKQTRASDTVWASHLRLAPAIHLYHLRTTRTQRRSLRTGDWSADFCLYSIRIFGRPGLLVKYCANILTHCDFLFVWARFVFTRPMLFVCDTNYTVPVYYRVQINTQSDWMNDWLVVTVQREFHATLTTDRLCYNSWSREVFLYPEIASTWYMRYTAHVIRLSSATQQITTNPTRPDTAVSHTVS